MSDSLDMTPVAPADHQTTNPPFLLPRRLSTGTLLQVEEQKWPDHPKNQSYLGSENPSVNNSNINVPADLETPVAQPPPDSDVETNPTGDIVDPKAAAPPTPSSPAPGSPYPGAGPHGLPIDGYGWRHHPSHKRCTAFPIDHNALNTQERTEAFILGDGEKKIEEKIDTRTPNTTIFTFNKEDHTLGNLYRDKLLKNSHVTFAAYRIPHPLFAKFELRVQTDGEITPKEALLASARDLVHDLDVLKTNFTREYELRKMVGGAQPGV